MERILQSEHAMLLWVHVALNRSEYYRDIKLSHKLEMEMSKQLR